MEYITIASQGNGIKFGDLTVVRTHLAGTSNSVKGVFGGGYEASAKSNVIDYLTLAVGGTAVDFGDLTTARGGVSATSNAVDFAITADLSIDVTKTASVTDTLPVSTIALQRYEVRSSEKATRPTSHHQYNSSIARIGKQGRYPRPYNT